VIQLRSQEKALRLAVELRHIAHILVTSGHEDLAERFVAVGAAEGLECVQTIKARAIEVSLGRAKPLPQKDLPVTFRELAAQWTSGELQHSFPHHIRKKKSASDDQSRFKRLNQIIGEVPLARFSVNDAQRAMRSLPAGFSAGTRRHYAQLIASVLKLAVFPCAIISSSPLPPGWLPRVHTGRVKARTLLYPDEERQLLRCSNVPLARRLLYGFLAREGCRLSEAAQLTWDDLDLARGLISLDENKTSDPRVWALGRDVVRALQAYKAICTTAQPFGGHDVSRMAAVLRRDLMLAGIHRPALFERSNTHLPFRLHDLRGTFITLALANGRSETWVCDRTGHRSSTMVNRYRRQARTTAEVDLGWLAGLDEELGLGNQHVRT